MEHMEHAGTGPIGSSNGSLIDLPLEQPRTAIARYLTRATNSAASKFDTSKFAIDEMVAEYAALVINGTSDSAGLKVVHEARMKCVRVRTSIDKRRKELTEESRKFIADVNDVAKNLTTWLEPTETRLAFLENDVEMEKKRIVLEAEEKLLAASRKRLQDRMDSLAICQSMRDPQTINSMTDEQFSVELKAAQEAYDLRMQQEAAENLKRLEEAERQRLDREKLDAERAELDRMKAETKAIIDEQNRILDAQRVAETLRLQSQLAEQKKLDDAKAAAEKEERDQLAAIEQERLQKEAVAQALKEREEQLEREKRNAEILAAREEALRPDREKLLMFAEHLQGVLIPNVSQENVVALIRYEIVNLADAIRRIVKENVK